MVQFVDSTRFIASSLSNLVNNLFGSHKIKCKMDMMKKMWNLWNYIQICDCFLEYANFKYDLVECKCFWCNKTYQQNFDAKLEELIFNTYKFSNHKNKLILLLRKGVYPDEIMDDWEKFNETSLPEKEEFYSNLNIEDITDAAYAHAKEVCKDFEIK